MRGQYKNKRDGNEADLFAALRANGLSVYPMDQPADALVGYAGASYLVEIKMPKGELTDPQAKFLSTWRGDYTILRTTEDVEAFVKAVKRRKVVL